MDPCSAQAQASPSVLLRHPSRGRLPPTQGGLPELREEGRRQSRATGHQRGTGAAVPVVTRRSVNNHMCCGSWRQQAGAFGRTSAGLERPWREGQPRPLS